jgi:hypothetical protein
LKVLKNTPLEVLMGHPWQATGFSEGLGRAAACSFADNGGARKVNLSAELVALVPAEFVTVTSTVPSGDAGEVAVIDSSEFTVKLAAATPPKATAVAAVSPLPEIVTDVPPVDGPVSGETEVMLGVVTAAASVNKYFGPGALPTNVRTPNSVRTGPIAG